MQHVVNSCSAFQQEPWFLSMCLHMGTVGLCPPQLLLFLNNCKYLCYALVPGTDLRSHCWNKPLAYLSGYILPCLKIPPIYFFLQSDQYKCLILASHAHQNFRLLIPLTWSAILFALPSLLVLTPSMLVLTPIKFFTSAFCASSQLLSCRGHVFASSLFQ